MAQRELEWEFRGMEIQESGTRMMNAIHPVEMIT